MILYGIKNCNTVKTAMDWLKKNDVEFDFHDYKKSGITLSKLREWSGQVGWEGRVSAADRLAFLPGRRHDSLLFATIRSSDRLMPRCPGERSHPAAQRHEGITLLVGAAGEDCLNAPLDLDASCRWIDKPEGDKRHAPHEMQSNNDQRRHR